MLHSLQEILNMKHALCQRQVLRGRLTLQAGICCESHMTRITKLTERFAISGPTGPQGAGAGAAGECGRGRLCARPEGGPRHAPRGLPGAHQGRRAQPVRWTHLESTVRLAGWAPLAR